MKLIDKTAFRSESGEINLINRIQGMLKFGMTWYDRILAQDTVAAVLAKQLGNQFTLMQNLTLPETDIDLPMILIGPPGIMLINALPEKGIYVARESEWGTIMDDHFVPERINQVKRTQTMARVLQIYLERLGHRGFLVEPIMMSGDPALHIDSTRPSVRVVMSDALTRFAMSKAQARSIFNSEMINDLEQAILTGVSKQSVMITPPDEPAYEEIGFSSQDESGSDGELDFSFTDAEESSEFQPDSPATGRNNETAASDEPGESRPSKASHPKRFLGISTTQWLILGAMFLFWLCSIVLFGGYILYELGWIQFA